MTVGPLQASFVVEYLPAWLATAIVAAGVTVALVSLFADGADDEWIRRIAVVGVGLGGALLVVGTRRLDAAPMMVGVVLVGKYIEGLTLMRTYQKLSYAVRTRSLPSTAAGVSGLRSRVTYTVVLVFLLAAAAWVSVWAVVWGPVETSLAPAIRLYWTLATVVVAVVALYVKLAGTDRTELPSGVKLGAILVIAGSEIYNLGSLRLSLAVYVAGTVAYSVGYWVGVVGFVVDDPLGNLAIGGRSVGVPGDVSEITEDDGVFERLPLGFVLGMMAVSLVLTVALAAHLLVAFRA
jgi:hypothetical protein